MNLLNTLTYIKEVCNAHPLVNESFIGSIYDINSRTDVKYATMSVQADTIARQASGKTDYNVYLYYADRIPSNDDREAILQVQTAAVNVMREILNYIKNYSDSIYIGSYTIHPFEQKFADETAGCWATVDIQTIDDIGDCSFDTSVIEEHFQNKVYLLENYYTKEEVDALLSSKQNTLIAGENITIEGNVISATGGSTLTAGENIEIEEDVISVPREVTLEQIDSPSGNSSIGLSTNNAETQDTVQITANGQAYSAGITLSGSASSRAGSIINIDTEGSYNAMITMQGSGGNLPAVAGIGATGEGSGVIVAYSGTASNPIGAAGISASGYSNASVLVQGGLEDGRSEVQILAEQNNGTARNAQITLQGANAEDDESTVEVTGDHFTFNDAPVAVEPSETEFTNGESLSLENNNIYSGSNITSLTLDGTGFTGDCLIQFTTGSTDPVVTITGVIFEDTPVFAINKYYEINIHNGHALWAEFTA